VNRSWRKSISHLKTNLEVEIVFLTVLSVNVYHNFGCNEKRRLICNERSDVISLLRRKLVFLIGEPEKIAKSSKGFFYHSFSSYFTIVLPRIFGEFPCYVKW
jgi:hypothetical protein